MDGSKGVLVVATAKVAKPLHAATETLARDPQQFGGLDLVLAASPQRFLDRHLFELGEIEGVEPQAPGCGQIEGIASATRSLGGLSVGFEGALEGTPGAVEVEDRLRHAVGLDGAIVGVHSFQTSTGFS